MKTPGTDIQYVEPLKQTGEPGTAMEQVETEKYIPPFHQALKAWMAANGKQNLQEMLQNPQGCGLGGQIEFNRQLLGDFVQDQYREFWKFFSERAPAASAALETRKGKFTYIFSMAAFTGLQTLLMAAIQNGAIPHPEGKKPGTARAGKPGSLEDDCARAIGTARGDLSRGLRDNINDSQYGFSSGSLTHDQLLIHAASRYLGLDGETIEYLDGRILEHYGVPNIHEAHMLAANLQTALLQMYGVDRKRTTVEEVIQKQLHDFPSWPEAYQKLPLLDVVLEDSLQYYNPERVQGFYMDSYPDEVDDMNKRVAEAHIITDALIAFRNTMCGTETVVSATRLSVDGTRALES